jgi:hypothetical protein
LERARQSRPGRFRARWRVAAALALPLASLTLSAATAGAAVTLGQLAPDSPMASCPASATDYLQPSITGGNLYIARQAGTITSWSTRSAGAGASYVFKVFRRTSDPDVFQVIAHATAHPLTAGVNTVPADIDVRSGDMIGVNSSGGPSSCTFSQPGDGILNRAGSVSDGSSGTFTPLNDVRLNLSATLVPTNAFTIAGLSRDKKRGTALVTLDVSNPGILTISGKGLKKRPVKNIAVAGTAQFQIAVVGARKRKLEKKGRLSVVPTITFTPANGLPALQSFLVRLKQRRQAPVTLAPTPG